MRSVCNHRRPAILDINNEAFTFSEFQHRLVMRAGDCPCCAVLSWWHADASKILALAKRVRQLDEQGLIVADPEGYYEREFSLHPRVFALSLISEFARMAHAVAEALVPNDGGDPASLEGFSIGRQNSQQDRPGSAYPLYLLVERHGLEPSTIEFEVAGRKAVYACSLDGAIAALRRAYLGRIRGHPKRRRSLSPGSAPRRDPWYVHIGGYGLQGKRSPGDLVVCRKA